MTRNLSERGDVEPTLGGEGPLPGKKRKERSAERVAKRVKQFKDSPPVAEGVVPLNPGFFKLERMRAQSNAKVRAKKRAKVTG